MLNKRPNSPVIVDPNYLTPQIPVEEIRRHFRKLVSDIKKATDEQLEKIRLNTEKDSTRLSKTSEKLVKKKLAHEKLKEAKMQFSLDKHLKEFKHKTDIMMMKTKQDITNKMFRVRCGKTLEDIHNTIDNVYADVKKEAEKLVYTASKIIERTVFNIYSGFRLIGVDD